MKKLFLTMALAVIANTFVYAQYQSLAEAKLSPKATEICIGSVDVRRYSEGYTAFSITHDKNDKERWEYWYTKAAVEYSEETMFQYVRNDANGMYGKTHPNFLLRDFTYNSNREEKRNNRVAYSIEYRYCYSINYVATAIVVIDLKTEAYERLPKVIDRVMGNVREGSRLAIDHVSVWEKLNKEEYKDKIIDVLLDKGYKVVAKEYLEKLYEEQLNQQSGIYNENTVVQENNFSAVGYYLNIDVDQTSIRAQLVNVSTGEYEGYVIENFNLNNSNTTANGNLSKALDKSLNNIRMGSRVAIDGVFVPSGTNKETYKDQIINQLLDKGYKVVAKDYLEKLYQEQQAQQSGIYNDGTTVQENNFSAVGYFLNVKLTETSVRVQVINVSTGEYEGNATINF